MPDPTDNSGDKKRPTPADDATIAPGGDATLAPSSGSGVQGDSGKSAANPLRASAPAASDRAGDQLGNYTLIEKLGSGGFGVVWKAERREPFIQQVALKILRPGMDSEGVLARFELERQALAMMDHPNIAKVIDGGVTDNGRNYFVMELVKGEPITDFCDRNKYSIEKRLELFAQVCDAIQHAHMKGIIHRDLKPGNILAGMSDDSTASGGTGARVKVIDFGVAKATSASSVAHDVFTQTGQMIGTPEYMSPEQADGTDDIDTRTDVYSLGIVLYQLLAGAPPFDARTLRSAGLAEINRIIRDADPPRPSAKLSSLTKVEPGSGQHSAAEIAKSCGMKPEALVQTLRRELEWLPMKAMRKDRAERYRSAAEFADDVRNYLQGKALIAGPESAIYRSKKFVRRHKVGVGAGLAIAASLVIATVISTISFIREARAREAEAQARQLAEKREKETRQIAKFQQDMLAQVDPSAAGVSLMASLERRLNDTLADRKVPEAERQKAVESLRNGLRQVNATDAASGFIDEVILLPATVASGAQFKEQPEVEAGLKQSLSKTYYSLGLPTKSKPLQERALSLRQTTLGADNPDTLESVDWNGRVMLATGEATKATPVLQQALEGRKRVLGERDVNTIFSMRGTADALAAEGKIDEALALNTQARKLATEVAGPTCDVAIMAAVVVAQLQQKQGKPDEAVATLLPLSQSLKAMPDARPRLVLEVLNGLALAQHAVATTQPSPERWSAAEASYRDGLAVAVKALGEEHPLTFDIRDNLAHVLLDSGRVDDSMKLLEQSIEIGRRTRAPGDPALLRSMNDLGQNLIRKGDTARAMPLIAEAERGMVAQKGADAPETLQFSTSYAVLLEKQGKLVDAIAKYQDVLARRQKLFPEEDISVLDASTNLGRALTKAKRFADAEQVLAKAEAVAATKRNPTSDARWNVTNQLLDTSTTWLAADPKSPVAARIPAAKAKVEELRAARTAAQPPLPTDWKRG